MTTVREDLTDVELVLAVRAGDADAFGILFDRWFDRVYDVAWRIVRDRELAAEVAQDAFVSAWRQLPNLEKAESFGGWVLRIGRNAALNRLQRERRSVALGHEETTMEIDRRTVATDTTAEAASADESAALLWAAADALGERDASVLDLHLRHGMGAPELAEALGVTPNNAHQLLFRLKGRLAGAIRSWVLWNDGSPRCAELAGVLRRAGIDRFGPEAVKVVSRHAGGCEACAERQRTRLAPEAMFAAVPLVVAAPLLKAKAAAALDAAGVPMGGSAAVGPGPSSASGSSESGSSGSGSGSGSSGSGSWSSGSPGGGAPDRRRVGRRRVALVAAAGVVAAVLVALVLTDPLADASHRGRTAGVQAALGLAEADGGAEADVEAGGPSIAVEEAVDEAAPPSTATEPDPGLPPLPPASSEPPAVVVPPPLPPQPSTTPTTAPPAPAPDPPAVSFRATGAGGGCYDLVWSALDATSVAIAGPGAPTGPQPTAGSAQACAPVGAATPSYTLTATGPGGTTSVTRP